MLIVSLSIYLYGNICLKLYLSDINSVGDQADIFINTISSVENLIISYFNESYDHIIEEIELIREIGNYWKDLYKELFCQYQKSKINFTSEKSLLLENEILEKLEKDGQILILTERKIEASLIWLMIKKLSRWKLKVFIDHKPREINYTGFGESDLSEAIMCREIEKFYK